MVEDSANWPLAYLITFRCYGTWLHGDARGSVDREHNVPGTPMLPANRWRESCELKRMKRGVEALSRKQREVVDAAIRETAAYRRWEVLNLNVRSNHLHVVVSAPVAGRKLMNTLKAWSTRSLRESGLCDDAAGPWARGGSVRHLWTSEAVERACQYVLEAQDGERFDGEQDE